MASLIKPKVVLRLLAVVPLLVLAHKGVAGELVSVGTGGVGQSARASQAAPATSNTPVPVEDTYEKYQRANQAEVLGKPVVVEERVINAAACNGTAGKNCLKVKVKAGTGVSGGADYTAAVANKERRKRSFQQLQDENLRAAELRQREMAERAERERLAAQNTQTGSGFADIFSAVAGAYAQQQQAELGRGQATYVVQQPQANAVQAAPSYGVVAPVPEPPRTVQPAPSKPVVGTVIKDTSTGTPQRSAADPPPPPHIPMGGPGCGPTGFC